MTHSEPFTVGEFGVSRTDQLTKAAPARSEHTAMNAATALDRIVLMSKYGGDATDRKADKEARAFIIRATENHAELLEALEELANAAHANYRTEFDAKAKARQALAVTRARAALAAARGKEVK